MQYRHHPVASQTGPDFAVPLPTNGYAWWYVDALSDCGRHGLTMIAMLGCVFSPWYAWARAGGRRQVDPLEHSALNLALYGAAGHRWTLTERGAGTCSAVQIDYASVAAACSGMALHCTPRSMKSRRHGRRVYAAGCACFRRT